MLGGSWLTSLERLPLHVLADRQHPMVNMNVVQAMVKSFPKALYNVDGFGDTPAQLAWSRWSHTPEDSGVAGEKEARLVLVATLLRLGPRALQVAGGGTNGRTLLLVEMMTVECIFVVLRREPSIAAFLRQRLSPPTSSRETSTSTNATTSDSTRLVRRQRRVRNLRLLG